MHTDYLGSVRRYSNADGHLIGSNTLHAYGTIREQAKDCIPLAQGFAGHQDMDDSGLVRMQARTYSPFYGRFLEPDPVSMTETRLRDPQRLNRYAYARNNPVNLIDPSGQILETIWDVTSIGIGIAELVKDPSWAAAGAVGLDLAATLIPGVPGGAGVAYRTSRAAEKALDAARHGDEVIDGLKWGDDVTTTITKVDPKPTGGAVKKSPGQIGREGEAAVRNVFDIGPQSEIFIHGRRRIPDGLTGRAISEVKNVKTLSFTRQLRDYSDFAKNNGLKFDLYVRPDTNLSGTLLDAVEQKTIRLRYIPQ